MTAGRAQCMAALRKANRVRLAKAGLKAELRRLDRAAAFERAVEAVRTLDGMGAMRVEELLQAVPKVGPIKARRWPVRHQVPPSRRLDELTARQRQSFVELLEGEAVR